VESYEETWNTFEREREKMNVLGLDLDGVVIDLTYLEEELGTRDLWEEDTAYANPEQLPPVEGVEKVFRTGDVEAIITRRRWRKPVEIWFDYWFGRLVAPIYCLGPVGDKARVCRKLGITVFVDDDYFTVKHLIANGIKGLWFTVDKDRDLYLFLKRRGVVW
jgi:FMN phosphatase YigB (HAD superfamily)